MQPKFFETLSGWREWLQQNHATEKELLVGFYKAGSGKPSITWPESVDGALCFGWIDGVRHSLGPESYMIRFTPRRPKSNWSAVNIARVAVLTERGLMSPAGLHAFAAREAVRSAVYAFEQKEIQLSPSQEERFRANTAAWAFFQAKPPGYRKVATWWVIRAKQELTRERRLTTLILHSGHHENLPQLRPRKG